MKLARLVYEIVKESIEFPSGMTEDTFIKGNFDDDRDFSAQISSVFYYVNQGFSRLLTNKKTLLKMAARRPTATGYIEFKEGEVTAVVDTANPNYNNVRFTAFGDGIAVEKAFINPELTDKGRIKTDSKGNIINQYVFIEYRAKIPHFDFSDIRKETQDEDGDLIFEEIKVNLEDYGITDEMCSYVKEYCKGGLIEYMSPDLAVRHTNLGETYMSALKTQHTKFPQTHVRKNVGGAW